MASTPPLSPEQELENYKHIELEPDEIAQGLLWAKKRKESVLNEKIIQEREAENRKLLSGTTWSADQTYYYLLHRATKLFTERPFVVDKGNEKLFRLLCLYFSSDPRFVIDAQEMGVKNPTLQKGILLGGGVGVGKTWMMKLFSKNQRQVFSVRTASAISDHYVNQSKEDHDKGKDPLDIFYIPAKLPANDMDNFYHTHLGLCLDDIGTEDVKNYYGNKKNVIGELIEKRYSLGHVGSMLHMTTNLTMDQVKEFYGPRVGSRLRESMNIVEYSGKDRRR